MNQFWLIWFLHIFHLIIECFGSIMCFGTGGSNKFNSLRGQRDKERTLLLLCMRMLSHVFFQFQRQMSNCRHRQRGKCEVNQTPLSLESDSSFFLMLKWIMPVRVDITPPPPANSKQPGITKSLLYNGSKFRGFQKSKGNSYEVEVVLQVRFFFFNLCWMI